MYYGAESINQGNPPPVCRLNGYGDFVYKNVPVIITNFNVELREQIDYIGITVPTGGQASELTTIQDVTGMATAENTRDAEESSGSVNYVPTDSLIAVTCLPIYSRNKITNDFTLKKFAQGDLKEDGFI
jgi:hypothetical protein